MAVYGLGAAAGGFADGFLKGRMAREQIDSNKMEKKLNEQRLKDAEREGQKADRSEAARVALLSGMQSLDSDYSQGSGRYAEFMPPQPEQMGVSPPPTGATGLQAPERPKSPWSMPGNIYRDSAGAEAAYYDDMSKLYKNYYAQSDQPDKALMVDDTISTMREKKVDKLVKGASAALFVGAPEALSLLDRVSSVAGMGRVDTKSGSFDPKTKTWTGVKMTQADGTEVVRDFTPTDMMSLANYGDPGKALEVMLESGFRERALVNQERGVTNDDKRLTNEERRIALQEEQAGNERADRAEDRQLRRERADVEILHQLISSSFKPPIEPDPSVFKAATYDDAAKAQVQKYNNAVVQYESRAELTSSMVSGAQNLMALNPGLKPQDAAYVVQNSDRLGKVTPDADGRYYLNFKGMRILLQ
jgi:hypothetical protein